MCHQQRDFGIAALFLITLQGSALTRRLQRQRHCQQVHSQSLPRLHPMCRQGLTKNVHYAFVCTTLSWVQHCRPKCSPWVRESKSIYAQLESFSLSSPQTDTVKVSRRLEWCWQTSRPVSAATRVNQRATGHPRQCVASEHFLTIVVAQQGHVHGVKSTENNDSMRRH